MKTLVTALLLCMLAIAACGQTPYQGDHPTQPLSVDLASVSLTAPSIVGGNSVEGRVTLLGPATSDIEVTLAIDPPLAARIPSSVTVKTGETSATFTVVTVISKIAVGGEDNVIGVYANYGVTQHTSLTILAPVSFDRMVDRVIARERIFVDTIKVLHPLAETYIQNMQEDKEHTVLSTSDQYFLGRLDLSKATEESIFEKKSKKGYLSPFAMLGNTLTNGRSLITRRYVPQGFANMVIIDRDFSKDKYYFNFVRQEFLGEIRCIVV